MKCCPLVPFHGWGFTSSKVHSGIFFPPLFTNREGKKPFLGWDSSYTIVNIWSRPDACALKVHLPPSPVRRSPGVHGEVGCQLISTHVKGISLNVPLWSGELRTQWTNSCSSPLVWAGQALFILTVTHFQHSVLLQGSGIYKSDLPPCCLISLAHIRNFRGTLTNFLANAERCHTSYSLCS